MAKANNNKLALVKRRIEDIAPQLQSAVPQTLKKYLPPERVARIVVSAMSRNPTLLQCTDVSIAKACLDSVSMGLEPGSPLGHFYLVPFRNNKTNEMEAQGIIGYRGLILMARRSGEIESVEAHVVHANDHFDCEFGSDPRLIHRPVFTGEMGEVIAAYSVAKFKGGGRHAEVMTRTELDGIRERSRAKNNGPWVTDTEEMYRKTVIRRASKYWPLSTEMADAMTYDDHADLGIDQSMVFDSTEKLGEPQEDTPSEPKTKSVLNRLTDKQEESKEIEPSSIVLPNA